MKTRYGFSVKQREAMAKVAQGIVDAKLEDVSTRTQYLWIAAMLLANCPAEKVNECIALMPEVTEFYARYRTDELADYVIHEKLEKAGVNIRMTKEEL